MWPKRCHLWWWLWLAVVFLLQLWLLLRTIGQLISCIQRNNHNSSQMYGVNECIVFHYSHVIWKLVQNGQKQRKCVSITLIMKYLIYQKRNHLHCLNSLNSSQMYGVNECIVFHYSHVIWKLVQNGQKQRKCVLITLWNIWYTKKEITFTA